MTTTKQKVFDAIRMNAPITATGLAEVLDMPKTKINPHLTKGSTYEKLYYRTKKDNVYHYTIRPGAERPTEPKKNHIKVGINARYYWGPPDKTP